MADYVHHPHDALFRTVFADIGEAQALLRSVVPRELSDRLDWKTLKLVEGSGVDETLKETHTDLLFEVVRLDLHKPMWLYVLVEHQSTPDPRMGLRLLTYACRIWNASSPDDGPNLRSIFPVVVYQGGRPWNHSQAFIDQFPEPDRTVWWLPQFRFHLLDQTGLNPEEVQGAAKGRITGQLLMAAFGQHRERALESARRSMSHLPPAPEVLYILNCSSRTWQRHRTTLSRENSPKCCAPTDATRRVSSCHSLSRGSKKASRRVTRRGWRKAGRRGNNSAG